MTAAKVNKPKNYSKKGAKDYFLSCPTPIEKIYYEKAHLFI